MMADQEMILRLLRTARGQIDGIEKMVAQDRYCIDICNQILAAESVLRKANKEILRAHMGHCVRQALAGQDEVQAEVKVEEIVGLLDKMSK
ncbi:metal-sensing transcriptional repressor [Christensenellaceae bacterium NSJ-44]|uniref:Copper-sensing transcriptional repressor CsoR n=1 Tax=Luoshenia tenuis TaxID=2763654 RepID=A0A926D1C4_9FIRM|nr:metal-sensing transcriptional repressor [Luoshenia tenuis]MBC8529747.1 metal-sensing transcriptional repressor [Luoshenia tenuis]